jgi:G:T-mismatch repair DNA endonuclease (very short patch repair protein)
VRIACAVCGREFERTPSKVKGKHGSEFCSRPCHYAGRSLGLSGRVVSRPYCISAAARDAWKIGAAKTVAKRRLGDGYRKTDETRAKLSAATARALAEGKIGVPSKLEDAVAVQLESLGATFARQHAFRDAAGRFACVVDFWFGEARSAIEVNGTYWHVDPRAYPVPINAMQARCLSRYRRKLQMLADLGVRVVELWELDFQRDPSQAVLEAYSMAARS